MTTIRTRWGVQHDFALRGSRAQWETLGTAWYTSHTIALSHVDQWPMSFQTRREAQAEVRALKEVHRRHSPHWRFRVVKLLIRIKEIR